MTRSTWARIGAALMAGMLAATLPTAAFAAPRPKPPKTPSTYVALGDSYASGTGAGSYLADGTSCYRSTNSYPVLLAGANNLVLDFQACSGSTIDDVRSSQLVTLTSATTYVTVTAGGNDVGFADTITTCLGIDTGACLAKVAAAEGVIATELPWRLRTLYTDVRGKAPGAKVVATTYPRLFNGRTCHPLTSFTSAEMSAMNAAADKLADAIRDAAAEAGVGFADVRTPFHGHAVCDSAPWINNVDILRRYNSFHPNATGQASGYSPTVKAALGLGGKTGGGTGKPKVTTGATTSTDTQRGQVRVQG